MYDMNSLREFIKTYTDTFEKSYSICPYSGDIGLTQKWIRNDHTHLHNSLPATRSD